MSELGATSDQSEILSYYERFNEANSLGGGLLEFARMQELIRRFLPSPPGIVLDVGGGPGRYACWLAGKGYEVHLIDPSKKHLRQAKEASDSQPDHPVASISLGDAREIDYGDGRADAVLLMGPLYHLTARDQRLRALGEAHRVLRPGGLLVATAINRFASLVDGLTLGLIDDPDFASIVSRDLVDGQHHGDGHDYFTTAFFHRPQDLKEEVLATGFDQHVLYSVKGPGELAKDLQDRMSSPVLHHSSFCEGVATWASIPSIHTYGGST